MALDQWGDEWPFDRDHLTGQPDPEELVDLDRRVREFVSHFRYEHATSQRLKNLASGVFQLLSGVRGTSGLKPPTEVGATMVGSHCYVLFRRGKKMKFTNAIERAEDIEPEVKSPQNPIHIISKPTCEIELMDGTTLPIYLEPWDMGSVNGYTSHTLYCGMKVQLSSGLSKKTAIDNTLYILGGGPSIVDGTLYIESINPETRLAPIKQVR